MCIHRGRNSVHDSALPVTKWFESARRRRKRVSKRSYFHSRGYYVPPNIWQLSLPQYLFERFSRRSRIPYGASCREGLSSMIKHILIQKKVGLMTCQRSHKKAARKKGNRNLTCRRSLSNWTLYSVGTYSFFRWCMQQIILPLARHYAYITPLKLCILLYAECFSIFSNLKLFLAWRRDPAAISSWPPCCYPRVMAHIVSSVAYIRC